MNDLTMNGMLFAAIGTLGSVVAFLYKQLSANYGNIQKLHNECMEDRELLWKDRANLWKEMAKLNKDN